MYKTVSCFCLAVILLLTNIGTGSAYYDPTVGRFITQDEYLGEPTTPPSLHRYLYAYSNPTAYVDPNGKEPISASIAVGMLIYSGYDYLFSERRERVAEQLDAQSTSGRIVSNSIALTQSVANTMTFGYFDATMQPGGEGTVGYAKERLGLNDLSNAYQAATDSKLAPDEKIVLTTLYGLKAAGEIANTGLMLTAAKGQFSSGSASLKNSQAAMEQAAIGGEAATISQREAMLVEEQLGVAAEGTIQEAKLTIENTAGKLQTTVRPVESAQPGGSRHLEKPTNPYSPDWNEWYRQNPDHPEARFRSLGAAAADEISKNGKTFITYLLKNDKGEVVYVGRASGIGTAEQVLKSRLSKGHHIYDNVPGLTAEIQAVQGNRSANLGAEDVWYGYHKNEGSALLNDPSTPPLSDKPIKLPKTRERIKAYAEDLQE
jgi:hypothetical protein